MCDSAYDDRGLPVGEWDAISSSTKPNPLYAAATEQPSYTQTKDASTPLVDSETYNNLKAKYEVLNEKYDKILEKLVDKK